uniref:Tetratricopeptide repeat domain 39B n=1 Tax=Trypanosoma congolense (strain IL3000) TaxID=1068625 RepID=G0UP84_TRYCI|nr:conserved hypothetical protein [Trypanosoma congolense IL3000]
MSSECASEGEQLSIHHSVEEAVHMTWNNEYEEAKERLSLHKGSNPRFSLEYANVFLIKTLMDSTNESREMINDLLHEADSLARSSRHCDPMFIPALSTSSDDSHKHIRKADRQKNKKEYEKRRKSAQRSGEAFDNTWKLECDVIYAEALFVRAVGQLMMNAYFRGAINLRKSWGLYYKLVREMEADTDDHIPSELKMCIKYGAGTFYVFLALVPSSLMKVLNVIGFVSDRELGEQYLTEVFESDGIRSPFAALALCTLYLFLPTGLGKVEETLAKAERILNKVNARYEGNTYFNGYSNFYHRKRGEIDKALETIRRAEANAERVGLVPILIRYLGADTLFMDLRFSEAKERYEALINHLATTKQTFAYTGQVVLSIAACCVMLGDDANALHWLQKVGSLYNPKSKNDTNSPKFAARVLGNKHLLPLCGVYMLYINRDLAHMRVEQAERVMGELMRVTDGKDMSNPEASSMRTLFIAVIHKGCGRTEEAVQEMEKIFASEKSIPKDSMVLPCAYYEMGELEYRRGRVGVAKELFTKGQSLRGDGNETLANRYRIALKQLKQQSEGRA